MISCRFEGFTLRRQAAGHCTHQRPTHLQHSLCARHCSHRVKMTYFLDEVVWHFASQEAKCHISGWPTSVDANHNPRMFGDADHVEKSSDQAVDIQELYGTMFCLAG